jgi:uncharacterized RDD family membrane protein YckC
MASWHYTENGQNFGPFDEAAIVELIDNNTVTKDTLVWNEDLGDWKAAGETELGQYFKEASGAVMETRTKSSDSYAQCTQCRNNFSQSDLVDIDGQLVCSECKPQMLRKMQEGVAEIGYFRYAGFWIRVVAYIVDAIILWIIQLPISLVLGVVMGMASAAAGDDPSQSLMIVIPIQILNIAISILIPLLYSVIFIVKKGATPGKMAVGIKVINADGNEKISVGKAFGRYFAKILSWIIFGIGFIMIAFDDQKRGLHDRICKTLVVYKK